MEGIEYPQTMQSSLRAPGIKHIGDEGFSDEKGGSEKNGWHKNTWTTYNSIKRRTTVH